MKIYIASPWSRKAEMNEHAAKFIAVGISVTAHWLKTPEDQPAFIDDADMTCGALLDLDDIYNADALVHYTLPRDTKYSGGGRQFEMGYAYALRKPIVVVGEKEHIFCWLPNVCVVDTTEEAITALHEIYKRWKGRV